MSRLTTEKYDFIRLEVPERWVTLMPSNSPLAALERVTAADLLPLPIIITKRAKVQNELASWFCPLFNFAVTKFMEHVQARLSVMQ